MQAQNLRDCRRKSHDLTISGKCSSQYERKFHLIPIAFYITVQLKRKQVHY